MPGLELNLPGFGQEGTHSSSTSQWHKQAVNIHVCDVALGIVWFAFDQFLQLDVATR